MISKLEENLWDIDIEKVGVSHARQNACNINMFRNRKVTSPASKGALNPGYVKSIKVFVAVSYRASFDKRPHGDGILLNSIGA